MPIVLFAQLHSVAKRGNKEMDSRIKDCPNVIEPATVIIEVVPDFELGTSDFIIHKDRFGFAGNRIPCKFDKGRYVGMSSHDAELLKATKKRTQGEGDLAKLQGLLKENDE